MALHPISSDPGEALLQSLRATCSALEQPFDDLISLSLKLLNSLASTPHRSLNPMRHPLCHTAILARDQNSQTIFATCMPAYTNSNLAMT